MQHVSALFRSCRLAVIIFTARAVSGVFVNVFRMHHWDRTLFLWLNLDPGDPDLVVALAMAASQWLPDIVLAGLALALLLGTARTRRTLLPVVAAMMLAWLGADLIKDWIVAPRPYLQGLGTDWMRRMGASGFPSTHTSIAAAFGMAVWLGPWKRRWRVVCAVIALLIAWSRMALGAHFPSDVAGAIVLGSVSALLMRTALARWTKPPQPAAATVAVNPPDRS